MKIFSIFTGCSLAQADEYRRCLGAVDTQFEIREIFYRESLGRGYGLAVVDQVWQALKAFGSFGFCKAHAAAFALPTYQSAWLKAHYPAAFIAGVLTHDPGMYPKRLILAEARNLGIKILPLDVNYSKDYYKVEKTDEIVNSNPSAHGIRISLSDISGISNTEISQILLGQPYVSLNDFWQRAQVSRPVVESLIKLGGFDQISGINNDLSQNKITRKDLLLQLADLVKLSGAKSHRDQLAIELPVSEVQPSGLTEFSKAEQVKTELKLLGIDSKVHVLSFYYEFLSVLSNKVNLVSSKNLLSQRSNSVVYVAGVKVAVQTPPIRSGNRVAFLTLEDSTGPIDLAFFEATQQVYANSIFNSWLVLSAGVIRKSGPNGISLRGIGCWELSDLYESWRAGSLDEVINEMTYQVNQQLVQEKERVKQKRTTNDRVRRRTGGMGPARRLLLHASGLAISPYSDVKPAGSGDNSGAQISENIKLETNSEQLPTKLWHKSPGVGGR